MMLRTYSLAQDGAKALSKSFKVKEFACKDGSDTILVDDRLVEQLQKIRDFFKIPVLIRSGYRTEAYNTRIGGARGSYHCKGMAADIDVGTGPAEVDPRIVAMFAQGIGMQGVGRYIYADGQKWVHVDTRTNDSFWIQSRPNALQKHPTFLPVLKKPLILGMWTNRFEVEVLQRYLAQLGYSVGTIDGKFWKATDKAVRTFQQANGLLADGIVGSKTWAKLYGKLVYG